MSAQKKHTTRLEDIEKKNNFTVPDAYFSFLNTRIIEKIKRDETAPKAEPAIFKLLYINKFALAASVVGLIVLIYTGIALLNDKNPVIHSGYDQIAEVFDFPANEIDDQMLFELYSSGHSNGKSGKTNGDSELIDAMIEYILNNDSDVMALVQDWQ